MMPRRRFGIGRIVTLLAGAVVLACVGFVGWIIWGDELPTPPPVPAEAGKLAEPQYAVTWVPGVGVPTYGACTRVLAVDGGGVRGLVPALVLAHLEERTGKPIAEQFDLIAGTSTGALLALGLTRPSDADAHRPQFQAADIVELYRQHASQVFPDPASVLRKLRRVFRPKYTAAGIEAVLAAYFGDVILVEALANVLVPAYDIEDQKRIWFTNLSRPFYGLAMKDVVRGATAAPTYLPPARFAVPASISAKGYVALLDGALFANNPAQEALRMAQSLRFSDQDHQDNSILLLSVGTGRHARSHTFDDAWGWGLMQWVDPLLDIAFSDPAIDEQVEQSMTPGRGQYARLQLETPVSLDDSSAEAWAQLTDATRQLIVREEAALHRMAFYLGLPRSPQCGPRKGADYVRPEGPRKSGK